MPSDLDLVYFFVDDDSTTKKVVLRGGVNAAYEIVALNKPMAWPTQLSVDDCRVLQFDTTESLARWRNEFEILIKAKLGVAPDVWLASWKKQLLVFVQRSKQLEQHRFACMQVPVLHKTDTVIHWKNYSLLESARSLDSRVVREWMPAQQLASIQAAEDALQAVVLIKASTAPPPPPRTGGSRRRGSRPNQKRSGGMAVGNLSRFGERRWSWEFVGDLKAEALANQKEGSTTADYFLGLGLAGPSVNGSVVVPVKPIPLTTSWQSIQNKGMSLMPQLDSKITTEPVFVLPNGTTLPLHAIVQFNAGQREPLRAALANATKMRVAFEAAVAKAATSDEIRAATQNLSSAKSGTIEQPWVVSQTDFLAAVTKLARTTSEKLKTDIASLLRGPVAYSDLSISQATPAEGPKPQTPEEGTLMQTIVADTVAASTEEEQKKKAADLEAERARKEKEDAAAKATATAAAEEKKELEAKRASDREEVEAEEKAAQEQEDAEKLAKSLANMELSKSLKGTKEIYDKAVKTLAPASKFIDAILPTESAQRTDAIETLNGMEQLLKTRQKNETNARSGGAVLATQAEIAAAKTDAKSATPAGSANEEEKKVDAEGVGALFAEIRNKGLKLKSAKDRVISNTKLKPKPKPKPKPKAPAQSLPTAPPASGTGNPTPADKTATPSTPADKTATPPNPPPGTNANAPAPDANAPSPDANAPPKTECLTDDSWDMQRPTSEEQVFVALYRLASIAFRRWQQARTIRAFWALSKRWTVVDAALAKSEFDFVTIWALSELALKSPTNNNSLDDIIAEWQSIAVSLRDFDEDMTTAIAALPSRSQMDDVVLPEIDEIRANITGTWARQTATLSAVDPRFQPTALKLRRPLDFIRAVLACWEVVYQAVQIIDASLLRLDLMRRPVRNPPVARARTLWRSDFAAGQSLQRVFQNNSKELQAVRTTIAAIGSFGTRLSENEEERKARAGYATLKARYLADKEYECDRVQINAGCASEFGDSEFETLRKAEAQLEYANCRSKIADDIAHVEAMVQAVIPILTPEYLATEPGVQAKARLVRVRTKLEHVGSFTRIVTTPASSAGSSSSSAAAKQAAAAATAAANAPPSKPQSKWPSVSLRHA